MNNNPKPWPYTITEVGYEIEMNDIRVGEGSTDRSAVIEGKSSERLTAPTVIANQHLDEWWVSHLERNEVTDLYVDFHILVDPDPIGITDAEPFRINAPELDYQTTIETDIFGTKPATDDGIDDRSSDGTDSPGSDGDGTSDDGTTDDSTDGDATPDDDGDATPTPTPADSDPTPTPTPDDGGIINGGSGDDGTTNGSDSGDDGLLSIAR